MKRQQEVYGMQLLKKEKYNKIQLKGGFLSSNDEEEVEVIVPPRTASSLQQKWSKGILPLETKFISISNRYWRR